MAQSPPVSLGSLWHTVGRQDRESSLPPKNILGISALKGNLENGDIYHIPDKIQHYKDVNSAQMVL